MISFKHLEVGREDREVMDHSSQNCLPADSSYSKHEIVSFVRHMTAKTHPITSSSSPSHAWLLKQILNCVTPLLYRQEDPQSQNRHHKAVAIRIHTAINALVLSHLAP